MSKEKKIQEQKTVRFWCEKYAALKTLIAGKKVKFSNHEFNTSDPVLIKGLEKLVSVEKYEDAMKRKQVQLDANVMDKLTHEVKDDLKIELREGLEKEIREELTKEIEKELREELTKKLEKELAEEIKAELEPKLRASIKAELDKQKHKIALEEQDKLLNEEKKKK